MKHLCSLICNNDENDSSWLWLVSHNDCGDYCDSGSVHKGSPVELIDINNRQRLIVTTGECLVVDNGCRWQLCDGGGNNRNDVVSDSDMDKIIRK